jgi:hypothetical protein
MVIIICKNIRIYILKSLIYFIIILTKNRIILVKHIKE